MCYLPLPDGAEAAKKFNTDIPGVCRVSADNICEKSIGKLGEWEINPVTELILFVAGFG